MIDYVNKERRWSKNMPLDISSEDQEKMLPHLVEGLIQLQKLIVDSRSEHEEKLPLENLEADTERSWSKGMLLDINLVEALIERSWSKIIPFDISSKYQEETVPQLVEALIQWQRLIVDSKVEHQEKLEYWEADNELQSFVERMERVLAKTTSNVFRSSFERERCLAELQLYLIDFLSSLRTFSSGIKDYWSYFQRHLAETLYSNELQSFVEQMQRVLAKTTSNVFRSSFEQEQCLAELYLFEFLSSWRTFSPGIKDYWSYFQRHLAETLYSNESRSFVERVLAKTVFQSYFEREQRLAELYIIEFWSSVVTFFPAINEVQDLLESRSAYQTETLLRGWTLVNEPRRVLDTGTLESRSAYQTKTQVRFLALDEDKQTLLEEEGLLMRTPSIQIGIWIINRVSQRCTMTNQYNFYINYVFRQRAVSHLFVQNSMLKNKHDMRAVFYIQPWVQTLFFISWVDINIRNDFFTVVFPMTYIANICPSHNFAVESLQGKKPIRSIDIWPSRDLTVLSREGKKPIRTIDIRSSRNFTIQSKFEGIIDIDSSRDFTVQDKEAFRTIETSSTRDRTVQIKERKKAMRSIEFEEIKDDLQRFIVVDMNEVVQLGLKGDSEMYPYKRYVGTQSKVGRTEEVHAYENLGDRLCPEGESMAEELLRVM